MKSYKLVFWRKADPKKQIPAKALGETIATEVPDITTERELCGHYEGFANVFLRHMGHVDYVTSELVSSSP